jgi:cobyrinic acid a,c-diamide synthase
MSGVLIAGTNSGSGKTTVSIGIMAALKNKGLCVQPFKVGPDYIDPSFHRFVTGKSSYNLDGFMLDDDTIQYVYNNTGNSDINIIEGVMGMYDGYGTIDSVGSSAHIAKTLDVPVILVIDGSATSTSAAATVLGFCKLDKDVNIAGVIVNKVSGEVHYDMIKKAVEHFTHIPCVGYLPKNEMVSLNSRHLGLVPANEVDELNNKVNELADLVGKSIDLDAIMQIAKSSKEVSHSDKVDRFIHDNKHLFHGKKIGVMRSFAFTFYYQSNIDLLSELGVRLIDIDPMNNSKLLDVDALYIGGGFPEVFAKELSSNTSFIDDLKNKLEAGLTCYAECGGLMYLTKSIENLNGTKRAMVGFFDANSIMTKRLQRFGYIDVDYGSLSIKCHEFHRSKLVDENVEYAYDIKKYRDDELVRSYNCGVIKNNTLAGYPHVHFLSNLEFVKQVFL